MSEIYLKRDNSLEVPFKLPHHREVEFPIVQKVSETLREAFETLSQQFSSFSQAFGVLRTLLLHRYSSDEEDSL